jgi:hypothetical protein
MRFAFAIVIEVLAVALVAVGAALYGGWPAAILLTAAMSFYWAVEFSVRRRR